MLVILFSSYFGAKATGDSLNYLLPTDTIFLSVGRFEEKVFEHHIERKQTLYSLAQFYGLSVEELYWFNNGLKDVSIDVGYPVRVPVPNRAIIRYQEPGFDASQHAPVYYVVKKGDTMYRIAKVFFRMPIRDLMERNGLQDTNLKLGQALLVGWMHIGGIPEEFRQVGGGPLARRNNALSKIYIHELGNRRERMEKGPAVWPKESQHDSDLYCLHNQARINDIIKINNPMTNRTVFAKVVGRIPATRYGPNIKVVLSPLAAKYLGAIDPKFYVKVFYPK